MGDNLLKYKIGVTLIKGIGPVLAKNLTAYLGSVEAIFKEKKERLAKIPGIGEVLANEISSQDVMRRAEEELEFIQKNNIDTFFYTDKSYPFRLKECADSPITLYYKGNKNLNDSRIIGIVGTRRITEYGREVCKSIVEELGRKAPSVCIVSGLAYGVDIYAHKAALESNLSTIGVLAHGLDRIYPATHRATAVKMLDNGGLLTEYITKTNPDKQNFVQRNRIIAGLCDALIVIESAVKGGALITAELGNDYNRDVFAVPGRVGDEFSAGSNKLIRENKAALIESADDLLRAMSWEPEEQKKGKGTFQPSLFDDLAEDETAIISELRKYPDGINVNELTVLLNLPFSKLSAKLLQMEFKGLVKCLPGGIYKGIV